MAETFKWGILGPGNIAKKFAQGVAFVPDAEVVAAASRSEDRAKAFCSEFKVPKAYGGYQALVEDPEIDAIYIATPHTSHAEHSKLCLQAGKPVLCEKPMTVNLQEAESVIAAARETSTFYMEAMWSRFLPYFAKIRQWLDNGAIGDIRMVQADFAFRCGWNPKSRLLDPNLAGGGLLDVGVYAISFASWVLGKDPVEVKASGHLGETGVDEQSAVILRFDQGELALLASGVRTSTKHTAVIYGTDGRIELDPPFWRGETARLYAGRNQESVTCQHIGNGYEYEAMAVADAVRAGKLEHPEMTWAESLRIMSIMDQARAEMGLSYPFES